MEYSKERIFIRSLLANIMSYYDWISPDTDPEKNQLRTSLLWTSLQVQIYCSYGILGKPTSLAAAILGITSGFFSLLNRYILKERRLTVLIMFI